MPEPTPRRATGRTTGRTTGPTNTTDATQATQASDAAPPPPARRSRSRDRADTEARILDAVGTVLAREGFAAVGVNAIAREAGVDKVLIYRYWGGLDALVAAWGRSGRFWPSVDELADLPADALAALPPAERVGRFIARFIAALRARPLTLEILAAEVAHHGPLAVLLEAEREAWGQAVLARFQAGGPPLPPALQANLLLWVAGLQFLLLRARRLRVFGGLDLADDAAWAALTQSVQAAAAALLDNPGARPPAPGL